MNRPRHGTVRISIRAWVCGDLAAHVSYVHYPDWAITHRPSGRLIVRVVGEWTALQVLQELARLPWPKSAGAEALKRFGPTLPEGLIAAAYEGDLETLRAKVDAALAALGEAQR